MFPPKIYEFKKKKLYFKYDFQTTFKIIFRYIRYIQLRDVLFDIKYDSYAKCIDIKCV